MDGRKNNKGTKGNKGGNPGFGALSLIRDNVEKHCPEWWEVWGKLMKGKIEEKKFAMSEFNKLQAKLMPTVVGGEDGKPLILQFDGLFAITPETEGDNIEPEEI